MWLVLWHPKCKPLLKYLRDQEGSSTGKGERRNPLGPTGGARINKQMQNHPFPITIPHQKPRSGTARLSEGLGSGRNYSHPPAVPAYNPLIPAWEDDEK